MGVQVDDRALRGSLRRLKAHLGKLRPVYAQASRHMRDYVRKTITLQGRLKPYQQLSWWTRSKTGRRKALITLRPRIKAAWNNTEGVVYFDPVSTAWHIDQHHTGYISKAISGKRMVVPKSGGGVLAVFTSRKESKVPAREIWPSQRAAAREIQPILKKWLDTGARKSWR